MSLPPQSKRYCPSCRYPTMRLMIFEGTSSRHAMRPEETGVYELHDIPQGFWILSTLPLRATLEFMRALLPDAARNRRRQRIDHLKRQILPEDPDALICPQCLCIVHSYERLC